MSTYRGGCHCRAIRFEVEGALQDLAVCNCSICAMTAYVHWEVDHDRFRLLSGADDVVTYEFGTRTAKHQFCRVCGISPFRRSRSNPAAIDVNARCLDDVDADLLETTSFDGRNWEQAKARE